MKKVKMNVCVTPPEITFCGMNCVCLDGVKGVIEYNGNLVKIDMGFFNVSFRGNNLSIKAFSQDGINVIGDIAIAEFEKY